VYLGAKRRYINTLPFLSFPSLPSVDSIRGFAHAAGFAAALRCLWFLVASWFASRHYTCYKHTHDVLYCRRTADLYAYS